MRKLFYLLLTLGYLNGNAQNVSTAKPWTYWWWMGSAVSKQDIKAQLDHFSKSGLGGVHIIPIYGVKGYENQNISFLTSEWLEMMKYTVQEGKKVGLGVDLTTGTGWPFGGPNIGTDLGARNMSVKDGKIQIEPTRQMVKRPAPGGAGLVLDPFKKDGMKRYLERFDSAFAGISERPRSMYMDSYEAYGANWTDDFLIEFEERRGYDLNDQLTLLKDTTDSENGRLVKIDYHQTLAELLRERYAHEWTKWSKENHFLTRYQAHGSPGNLLDLYDEADIPETESFGTSRFPIPGLRIDPDYSIDQFGTPNPLAMKFASSAAHFSGKKLVSSETGTWLANHFKVSLSQVKPQIDELFTAGINHIFYHGTTYSPISEVYPGWLFYASTNFGPTSHFAGHFQLLNQYVERCQALLQNTKPDNDVLVYFPIHDLWAIPAKSAGGVHLLEVHHVDRWLLDLPFGKLSQKLWQGGYTFDFVSDRQLARLVVDKDGSLNSGHAKYKTILVPVSKYMPTETLSQLSHLAKKGAKIVFEDHLPEAATGFALNASKQKKFLDLVTNLGKTSGVKVVHNLQKAFVELGVKPESWASQGLTFIRKKDSSGPVYFVANNSNTFTSNWITLSAIQMSVESYDPLTGKIEQLQERQINKERQVFLSLAPGESCFLRASSGKKKTSLTVEKKNDYALNGHWKLEFLNGRPSSPPAADLKELKSWTELPDSAVYFSGTASYTIRFDLPEALLAKKHVALDLGDVREVAEVKINGKDLGTTWSIPFRLGMNPQDFLKPKDNILEVRVTNLSANYMRLRDTQAPDWKKFYDINIVDITYKKFNASNWQPMPSGLLGRVKFSY
jgi:hypothetical protein